MFFLISPPNEFLLKKSFIFHPLGALVLNEELTPSGVHIVEIKTGLNCTHVHTVHGVHTKHYIHRVQCKGEVSRYNEVIFIDRKYILY